MKAYNLAVAAILSVSLSGCAPNFKVILEASQEDASIYVDGDKLGKGAVSLDVGPEYNYPRSYDVKVVAPGRKTVVTTISNNMDWNRAWVQCGTSVGIGALLITSGALMNTANPNPFYMGMGVLCALVGPVAFINSNRFKKTYEFELETVKDSNKSPDTEFDGTPGTRVGEIRTHNSTGLDGKVTHHVYQWSGKEWVEQ